MAPTWHQIHGVFHLGGTYETDGWQRKESIKERIASVRSFQPLGREGGRDTNTDLLSMCLRSTSHARKIASPRSSAPTVFLTPNRMWVSVVGFDFLYGATAWVCTDCTRCIRKTGSVRMLDRPNKDRGSVVVGLPVPVKRR